MNHRKNFGKVLALVLCMLLICTTFFGCDNVTNIVSGVAAEGTFPVEINGVTVSGKPTKVAVLSPSLADVVLALGYETQLAAGSEACTQSGLADLPKVSENDPQAVIDLGVDLVLADNLDDSVQSAFTDANIPVVTISPAVDRNDFERLYSQVASVFQGGGAGEEKGASVAQDIFIMLDEISRIVPSDRVTTACYLYDLESSAVTGDMLGSVIMTSAGVTNIFNSLKDKTYSFEDLRLSNPSIIFCVPGLKEEIMQDSRLKDFQAVKQGKVIEMDPKYMEWQGRTIVETAYEISAAAYPELLETKSSSSEVSSEPASSSSAASEVSSGTSEYTELTEGTSNEDVLRVQARLAELGYLTEEYDGHYGSVTAACVKEFQKMNGLEETGVADVKTQEKLFSSDAVAKGEDTASSSSSSASSESSSSAE